MSLHLVDNWRAVLRKSWSLKLITVAGILTGVEAMMGVIPTEWLLVIPSWVWPVSTLAVTAAAFIARLIAQDSLKK